MNSGTLVGVQGARRSTLRWTLARGVLFVALAVFYVTAATEQARQLNGLRTRADQSRYLWSAVAVYKNWHGESWDGESPPFLIGYRNQMPLYPGFLALF